MAGEPQIWHYGLVARIWGETAIDDHNEGPFFRRFIKRVGEPGLDLGCGSGRLLIPMLQAGLSVDGCDYSADMLDVLSSTG